jgi:hypothetical protein
MEGTEPEQDRAELLAELLNAPELAEVQGLAARRQDRYGTLLDEIHATQEMLLSRLPAPPDSFTAEVSNATGLAEQLFKRLQNGEHISRARRNQVADAVEQTARLALALAERIREFPQSSETAR